MSFLNGVYEATDIQLNGENSADSNTNGGAEFYLISTLGENFVIYVDGTAVFVLNSSTGVLTISTPTDFTNPITVNGALTTPSYLSGGGNSNLNTGSGPFQFITGTAQINSAYGIDALKNLTTGSGNTAVGEKALKSLTTGGSNTAFGSQTLENVTTGILNLGFGYLAGNVMVSSIVATCIGYSAGSGGFQGNYVNLFGNQSYIASAGLEYSTCLGTGSFIDANYQVAIGRSLDTIIIRGNVGLANTDSTNKIASTAFTQSAINRLLYFNATTDNQIFNDIQFPLLTTGVRNIGVGDCFKKLTSGSDNVCVGSGSMNELTSGTYNACIGSQAFQKLTTGTENFCLGGLSMREVDIGSFNVSVGVQNLANGTSFIGNVAIGRYVLGSARGNDNVSIGYFSGLQLNTGNSNTIIGAYSSTTLITGSNNCSIGPYSGTHVSGSAINASNNTYIGADTKMSGGTTFANSTCIGYNSRITASNTIFLGTANEVTIAMGGLNIPVGETLQVNGFGSFDYFDNTAPNFCGSSFVSPVFRPKNFTLFQSINNSCHAFGSNSARSLLYDPTNSGVYCHGQDNLDAKTLNSFNVTSIGGGSMRLFTSESFSGVTVVGQGNLSSENGYSMNNVTIIGGSTTFKNGAIVPTSVTNAVFNNAYGIQLASASAISNVFAIRTNQPITKSNQGIIGDQTEIILNCTNQRTIVTGTLELDEAFQASIFSPTLNWSSANFNLSATTKFLMYYHFILNAATTVTLPAVTAAMVGQEFTFKRRGGALFALSITTTTTQPVFPTGNSLGVIAFPYSLISATQSTAKLMCIQSHFAGSGTGTTTLGSNVLTVVTWNTLPSAMITIGTVITLGAVVKRVSAYGTGRGGTGTYTMDTTYAAATITPQPISSTDQFGYDILNVQ